MLRILACRAAQSGNGFCGVQCNIAIMHDASFLHHLIANFFNLFELLWLHWLVVGEVESQLVLCNERTFLIYLLAQDLTQREVQDVRCCVVLCHQRSSSVVDLGKGPKTNKSQLPIETGGFSLVGLPASMGTPLRLLPQKTHKTRPTELRYGHSTQTRTKCKKKMHINQSYQSRETASKHETTYEDESECKGGPGNQASQHTSRCKEEQANTAKCSRKFQTNRMSNIQKATDVCIGTARKATHPHALISANCSAVML